MEGRRRDGARLLRPRGQRGEPQAQPQRQPGQVCRVVEKVKFQAGVHQALGTALAADTGEWRELGASASFRPHGSGSLVRGAELALLALEPGELVEPLTGKVLVRRGPSL